MVTASYTVHVSNEFGKYVRELRESKRQNDKQFSLRQIAKRVGVEPAYLSKIERGEQQASEKIVLALARELDGDANVFLALAGRVSEELLTIIRDRPQLFAEVLRQFKKMPEHAILRVVREVRDGDW